MNKIPTNLPKEGNEVYLKGRGYIGTGIIERIDDKNWTWIIRTSGRIPKICHLYELAIVDTK